MASGDDVLIIRSDKGTTIALPAQKVALPSSADKTQVVMSKDGDTWSLDKMVIEGAEVSYQFTK